MLSPQELFHLQTDIVLLDKLLRTYGRYTQASKNNFLDEKQKDLHANCLDLLNKLADIFSKTDPRLLIAFNSLFTINTMSYQVACELKNHQLFDHAMELRCSTLKIFQNLKKALPNDRSLQDIKLVIDLNIEDICLGFAAIDYMTKDRHIARRYLDVCKDIIKRLPLRQDLCHRFVSYYLAEARLQADLMISVRFDDPTMVQHAKQLLTSFKIPFKDMSTGFDFNSCEVTPKMLRKVWLGLNLKLQNDQQAKKTQANDDPNVIVSQEEHKEIKEASKVVAGIDEKEAKLNRHLLNEAERNAAKNQTPEKENKPEPIVLKPIKPKIIKWQQNYPEADLRSHENMYYSIFGREGKKTFARISQKAIEKMPTVVVEKKIMTIVKEGEVYSSKNSKGKEGYVFYTADKLLTKKHGSEYTCKIKIFGSQGAGNMRLLGKKVADGKLFSGDKVKDCELFEFDIFELKAHKSK